MAASTLPLASPAAPLRAWITRHDLGVYCALAILGTWSIWIPLIATRSAWASRPMPVYYLASWGPLLAAVIVTAATRGVTGLRELGGRMLRWRVAPVWWVVAVSPLIAFALLALGLRVVTGARVDVSLLGRVNFLPDLGALGALLLWCLSYGLGEETGWRGFALPRLQRKHGALAATLRLSAIIALWHAPAFLLVYDPRILPGFLPGLVAGAIVFTWLYNSTRGSILIAAVWHGAFNFVTASAASAGAVAAILTTAVMVWAVAVVMIYRPAHLARVARQVTG